MESTILRPFISANGRPMIWHDFGVGVGRRPCEYMGPGNMPGTAIVRDVCASGEQMHSVPLSEIPEDWR